MSLHIIVPDLHLGKNGQLGKVGIGSAYNSRLMDQSLILDWLLDQATDKSIDNIILTGDIFQDTKPHPVIIKLFIKFLRRCENEGIIVDIIHGNHDIFRSGQNLNSALDIISEAQISTVNIYDSVYTKHNENLSFTFLPFRDRRSFNVPTHDEAIELLKQKLIFEISDIPAQHKKVLIGHLALEGSIYVGDEISDASNELFCPLDMFAGYDYVWMGHVHRPQIMRETPHIAHIGSMDLSDFGETDHKKIIIIIDSDSKDFFKEVTIPTRPLIKMSIDVPKTIVDSTAFVVKEIEILNKKTQFDKAIVRLEINIVSSETLSIDRRLVEKKLFDLGTFHISGLREVKKISIIKKKAEDLTNISDFSVAVKTYSNLFIEEDVKEKFVSLAASVIEEYKAVQK